jgi:hypothetical protein
MAYVPQTPFMAYNLPPDVYQAAAAAQLGEQPRAEYRAQATGKRLISGIICLIIGLVFVGGGVAAFMSQASDSSSTGSLLILALIGVLLIAGGIYYMLYGVIYKNWGVYVYERGFAHKKGSEAAQPFRWDQIEAVWYNVIRHYRNGVYTGTTHNYRVRRVDGYEIVLNDRFANVAALGDTVSNQVTGAKMPQVIAAYNAGQTITFGPLSLNRQGIQNANGNLLPWPEIKDVSLQKGYVAVSKAGKWLRWSSQPVRNIPNVFLFITMVKFILKK